MHKIINGNLIREIDEMQFLSAEVRSRNASVGLVPTMGALHEGHLSLIKRSALENDFTVVSIFVNPIQFDDPEDLASYPSTLSEDANLAADAGSDVIFAPDSKQMYPEGFSTFVDMTGITGKLCGASRESHFKGVLTVVNKLFNICDPDKAYFGEKDIQQLSVVKKMVTELCMNIDIVGCPTIREEDGLALSSRNKRLTCEERIAARAVFRALTAAKALFDKGETSPDALKEVMRSILIEEPLARTEYAELVGPVDFETPKAADNEDILMLAVNIGNVRLIDNMRL
jgi:pantoate--beta-alanine ligase